MIFLQTLLNAVNPRAVAESNAQLLDASLAFMLGPTLVAGAPNTTIGPPGSGTFVTGQFWVDSLLAVWFCNAGGSPGTWSQQTPANVAAAPEGTIPANYLIVIPSQGWAQFYYNGSAWVPVFLQPTP